MRRIVNISMTQSLYSYVDERSRRSGFGSVSEYVRDLIRTDQRRHEEKLEERMDREVRYHRDVLGKQYLSKSDLRSR